MRPLEHMRPPGRQWTPVSQSVDAAILQRRATMLSNVLSDREYLLGSKFSGADILVGHSCFMATHMRLIGDLLSSKRTTAGCGNDRPISAPTPDLGDFIHFPNSICKSVRNRREDT